MTRDDQSSIPLREPAKMTEHQPIDDPRNIRPADRMRPQNELSLCRFCERYAWRLHRWACDDCARSLAEQWDHELSAGWGSPF